MSSVVELVTKFASLNLTGKEKSLHEAMEILSKKFQEHVSLTEGISKVFEQHGKSEPFVSCPDCGTPVLLEYGDCPLCGTEIFEVQGADKPKPKKVVTDTKAGDDDKKASPKKEVVSDKAPAKKVNVPSVEEIEKLRMSGLSKLIESLDLEIDADSYGKDTKGLRKAVIAAVHGSNEEAEEEIEEAEVVETKPAKKATKLKVVEEEEEEFEEEEEVEEEVEEPVKKKVVKKEEKKVAKKEVEESSEGDFPSVEEVMEMSFDELKKLIKKEKLDVDADKNKRNLSKLKDLVNKAIDEKIDGEEEEFEEEVEEPVKKKVVKKDEKKVATKAKVEDDDLSDFELDDVDFDDFDLDDGEE